MHPSNLSRLSLSARISMVVAAMLILAGAVTGYAIFQSVQHSLLQDVDSHINARISWVEASIELDHGHLEFEPNQAHLESDVAWQVSLRDGRVLWAEKWGVHAHKTATRSNLIVLGDPKGEFLTSDSVKKLGAGGQFGDAFLIPENGKLELRLEVRAPVGNINEELHRLSLALWTIGPLSILLLSIIFTLFIRRQLKPLREMALIASNIGPQDLNKRIESAGNSEECLRLRDSINTMIDRLTEGLNRERQFAYAAAHELRTPVAQLRTSLEVALRKQRTQDEYRGTVSQSLEDVVRMQALIEQLLLLTKHQQSPEMLEDLSLMKILTKAQKMTNVEANCTGAKSDLLIKGKEELILCGIRNVLENATRYAPGRPPEISILERGKEIQVAVMDHGPGIAESNRERIFEPLMRLDQARSIGDTPDGFGLGLTVARSAIRACGGDLYCQSRGDGSSGAVFIFKLLKA